MPLKTTIVFTKARSISAGAVSRGHDGFRTVLTVTETTNITSKIFVFLREAITSSEDVGYQDTFYTVSCVSDLETLPEAPTSDSPYYRTNSIDLIFRSKEDLEKYEAKIISLIERLRLANDQAINLQEPVTVAFPSTALARYWGLSVASSVSDAEIQAFDSEAADSRATSKELTAAGPRYLWMAYPVELGQGVFTLDGVAVDVTLDERAFVDADGHSHDYLIYRTTDTQSGSNLVFAVS